MLQYIQSWCVDIKILAPRVLSKICQTINFTNYWIWFRAISPLHSGITEEDLRAAGVTNPSHRRRILENLPRNWNWHAKIKTLMVRSLVVRSIRTGRSVRTRDLKGGQADRITNPSSWTFPRPCHLFIYSINTVTIVCLCQHSKGNRAQKVLVAQSGLIHLSILTDNDRCGWYKWKTLMRISSYWHFYKHWLWHHWFCFKWILSDYKNIVLQFPVFTQG